MREIRTSGLMSGVGNRDGAYASAPAPSLDSTDACRLVLLPTPPIASDGTGM